jgi:exopolysaccharide biosynthesis protein
MSLRELSWLFRRSGASDALNLDGGGSTAPVIHGQLKNRPSDREGERPVGNALVLPECDPR